MQNEQVNASGFFFCFGDVKTFTNCQWVAPYLS